MTQWWNELSTLSQIFACMAIPATLILVIQTIMVLIGMGEGHSDMDSAGPGDMDGDTDMDIDDSHDLSHAADGLRVFTVRGLVAFFSIGGWVGVTLSQGNVSVPLTVIASLISGLVAMVLVALIFKWALSLQDSGNIALKNAVGLSAQVYLTIPAQRGGSGKITMILQERFMELDAVTDSQTPLATGQMVTVKGIVDSSFLLVG